MISSKRKKGFELAYGFQPTADRTPVALAPCLGGEGHLHGVEQGNVERSNYRIMLRFDVVDDAAEPRNHTRSRHGVGREIVAQRLQQWSLKCLCFEAAQNGRE